MCNKLQCTKVATRGIPALVILWFILFLIFSALQKQGSSCKSYQPLQLQIRREIKVANKQQRVKEAFQLAFNSYVTYAFGSDELLPKSKTSSNWLWMGLTVVDSIDTMYLMGLNEEYEIGKEWIQEHLVVDKLTNDISTFETTIRVVGGLLSMYQLTNDGIFLEKAEEVGKKLILAFDTPSGIPYPDINIQTGKRVEISLFEREVTSIAEAGSLQMEFSTLANLTNNPEFETKAMRVFKLLNEISKPNGLYPMHINPETGKYSETSTKFERLVNDYLGGYDHYYSLGGGGDSFYEYLLKVWILSGKRCELCRQMYEDAMRDVISLLVRESEPSKLKYVIDMRGDQEVHKMQHLTCFVGGMLALGAYHKATPDSKEHMKLGKELTRTCREFQKRQVTGLGPEEVQFESGADFCNSLNHYYLRPEIVESFYVLYMITNDETYQHWAWDAFLSIEKFAASPFGYCGIKDVTQENPTQDNLQQSFFLAETLKYLYLIFTPKNSTVINLDKWVFNTEAHPLKVRF